MDVLRLSVPCETEEQRKAVAAVTALCVSACGGATVTQGTGHWFHDGKVVCEAVCVIEVWGDNCAAALELVKDVLRIHGEHSIGFVFNGKAHVAAL
jgi:hypothetical protein